MSCKYCERNPITGIRLKNFHLELTINKDRISKNFKFEKFKKAIKESLVRSFGENFDGWFLDDFDGDEYIFTCKHCGSEISYGYNVDDEGPSIIIDMEPAGIINPNNVKLDINIE